jgi:hypothetical protein
MLGCLVSGDCPAAHHILEVIVVPLVARLRRSVFLASKLVFPVFPSGHVHENVVIDFSKIVEMDRFLDGFVTK